MSYVPHTSGDRSAMLEALHLTDVAELFADIPPALKLNRRLRMPHPLSEMELMDQFQALARTNRSTDDLLCFLGGGATDRYIPAMVEEVMGRAEFLTAYTPYQAEISQGTLQAIYEFQTLIAELTGMDIAQASMYDGATAVAEAVSLAVSQTGRRKVVLAATVHPRTRQVVHTYAAGRGFDFTVLPEDGDDGYSSLTEAERAMADAACLVVQEPNYLGALEPVDELTQIAHAAGALIIAAVDPISLAVLEPPGAWGADVAVGEGQSLGLPLSYGGPYLGFFAARKALVRRLPGRLAGATFDVDGKRGFALTFQTREQHIRREKATSNICTNQGLLALGAAVYLASLGPDGLGEVAERSLALAHHAAERISAIPGYRLGITGSFFDEFTVVAPASATKVRRHLLERGILGGTDLSDVSPARRDHLLFAVTERRTVADIDRLVEALSEVSA